ncbi:hypothetical protein SCLCIDRAFT_409629 [Scleroderma citrinum Foug A]|uniref:Calcineurin-like phosphoesterase domain-containing protein n=1 Tax=Scleroderma citrinum Foug A TaxID=1036808 RepID=A0A0C3DCH6_9AGAM|nr:hypothetical protein SCLCIDRAFT_409629 [Scleroderma citrinum Foug A]
MLLVLLLLGLCSLAIASPAQVLLDAPLQAIENRRLHGRFLHITDMHPDPYYKPGSRPSMACHRGKPKKKRGAGYYGTPYKECDSPFALTNLTLDHLDKRWSNEIDFVIWTGDSASDDDIPRPLHEIYDLNSAVARKMEQVFSSKGIPVIPTIGNNDIWPHNTLASGPNDITRTYSSIWQHFIPAGSHASFLRGGYFSVEVIPDALAVISLNTMYFYASNEAVQGCAKEDDDDPGNQQFGWLEDQLAVFRSRQMQVWMMGHVPPKDDHYYPRCYAMYAELSLRFQDTILGHVFGHLNTDHFYFITGEDLRAGMDEPKNYAGSLFDTLMSDFSRLPDPAEGVDYSNYVVVNVSPSVVPNPYVPTFRAYAYNTSGLTGTLVKDVESRLAWGDEAPHRHGNSGNRHDGITWGGSVDPPSRRNSLWTPLGYAQYWMPTLDEHQGKPPEYELEYLTFSLSRLHGEGVAGLASDADAQPLIPLTNLPDVLRDGTVRESSYAPYSLADLTVGSWAGLGWRMGRGREEGLRERFRRYLYVGGA